VPVVFITERRELQTEAAHNYGGGSGTATRWGELFRIYIAHGFSWIGVQTMFVYIIAFIHQKMLATADPGVVAEESGRIIAISFAILNTVGFLLPAPILEPLAMRFGRVRVHLTALAIMAAGYFAIAASAAGPLMLYLLMGVVGIGWASIVSLPFAIMTEKVEKSRMGFFMGIFNLSVVLPQLFVSLVLGTVIQRAADKSIIFLISGLTLAVSAVVWLLVHEPKQNIGTDPAGGRSH
jgi:MFS family permease